MKLEKTKKKSNREMECPYCKFLYNLTYGSGGKKKKFEGSVFDCSSVLQDLLYICNMIQQYDTEEYLPPKKDFSNGILVKKVINYYLNDEKFLFKGFHVSEELKNFYNKTKVSLAKMDYKEIFGVMFNLLIIMGSISACEDNQVANLVVTKKPHLIDKPIIYNKPKYFIRHIFTYKSEDSIHLEKERDRIEKHKRIVDQVTAHLNKANELPLINKLNLNLETKPDKNTEEFLKKLIQYKDNILEQYFLKMLQATAVAALGKGLWLED